MINTLLLSTALNTGLIFSGQAIDYASTQVALSRCPTCYESNPFLQNQGVALAVKLSFATISSYGVAKLHKSGHKKTARAISITLFIVPAYIGYRNMKVSK